MRVATIFLPLVLAGCNPMPQGSGPSPSEILVVASDQLPIQRILEVINKSGLGLDPVIDKSNETLTIGDGTHKRYPQYEYAFWYPKAKSEYYGVALVKWIGNSGDMAGKYFIDVYSNQETCSLCKGIKKALNESQIVFYSACEQHPKKTEYEEFVCDT